MAIPELVSDFEPVAETGLFDVPLEAADVVLPETSEIWGLLPEADHANHRTIWEVKPTSEAGRLGILLTYSRLVSRTRVTRVFFIPSHLEIAGAAHDGGFIEPAAVVRCDGHSDNPDQPALYISATAPEAEVEDGADVEAKPAQVQVLRIAHDGLIKAI